MANLITPGALREQLSPANLLARLGHQPVSVHHGYEQIYRSMLRPDRHGHFVVDTRLGLWFDRGGENPSGIRCGDVLDLGRAIFHPLSGDQLLSKLTAIALRKETFRRRRPLRIPDYRIADIRPLGGNELVSNYLRSEGLWELALGQLKEVHYYTLDQKMRRKDFCAAGWPNENGGWEIRARHFSGRIGPAGMTFLPGDEQQLVIFFDFKDYLVWRYGCRAWTDSALVINDPRFSDAAVHRARQYRQASVYAGKEQAGENLLNTLMATGARCIYLDY